MIDIAVIGGGASGMMAALAAKRTDSGLNVTVFERQARVGRKLLATGNGRCNITNARCESPEVYNNAFAARVIARAGLDRTLERFKEMGLECRFDEEGRAYPESDMASSVVDCLRLSLDFSGVSVETGREVKSIKKKDGAFVLSFREGADCRVRRVIIACGGAAGEKLGGSGSGYALLKALGHSVTAVSPALTQLKTPVECVKGLKGIKRLCEISLEVDSKRVASEKGEILFCDYGISGIAAMALSREAGLAINSGKRAQAVIRISDMSKSDILLRAKTLGAWTLDDFLSGVMPKRLGQQLLKKCDIFPLSRECRTLDEKQAERLADTFNAWRVPITGVNGFSDAQVTCGGADVSQFKDSLQSKICPGLYAAGEVLDVDGPCGGFNLHWAWSSGMISGESCARGV